MNLPNYFLADLPPEATLNAVMIGEACQTLRRNRERYLAHRSTQSLVHLLSHVAAEWLKPEDAFRNLALDQGPVATGFSRATLASGLDSFFKQLTPENFAALLEQDLGHPQRLDEINATEAERKAQRGAIAVAPELLVHIAAGNLPNPTLMSIVLGVLVRSARIVERPTNQNGQKREPRWVFRIMSTSHRSSLPASTRKTLSTSIKFEISLHGATRTFMGSLARSSPGLRNEA